MIETGELGGYVSKTTSLCRNRKRFDYSVERRENPCNSIDRIARRVDADDRIATAIEQSLDRREQEIEMNPKQLMKPSR